MIQELLNEAGLKTNRLDAVAISGGPGSYTGLRIGLSVAKGICYGLSVPLIAIDTLKALAKQFLISSGGNIKGDVYLCPMIDARRMEVYTALFDLNLNFVVPTSALIIDETSFSKTLKNKRIIFFGNGSAKCKQLINHENTEYAPDVSVSSRGIALLASEEYDRKNFVDTAYFEPFYLKEFIAGKPKTIL